MVTIQLLHMTENYQHTEGEVAKTIEKQTAKLPSDLFLWTAIGAMGISSAMHLFGKKHAGLFFGQWVAPFLLFGIYNKIVKTQGHDRQDDGMDSL